MAGESSTYQLCERKPFYFYIIYFVVNQIIQPLPASSRIVHQSGRCPFKEQRIFDSPGSKIRFRDRPSIMSASAMTLFVSAPSRRHNSTDSGASSGFHSGEDRRSFGSSPSSHSGCSPPSAPPPTKGKVVPFQPWATTDGKHNGIWAPIKR